MDTNIVILIVMCIVLGVIEPFIDFDTQSLLFYLRFYLIYIYIYIYMFLHIGWTTFSKSFLTYSEIQNFD